MSKAERAIGIFDSGLGGISVLKDMHRLYPHENLLYFGDSQFAPYGVKQRSEITSRCIDICEFLISKGVKAIVIACNTATSAAVDELRKRYPNLPIIGMEPALKPAIEQSNTHYVAVMATNFTLKEKKFSNLMKDYQEENTIIKIPCPELVQMVENDELDNKAAIDNQIHMYFNDIDEKKLDTIVLGCTHFIFFREHLQKALGKHIQLIDGNEGTCRHLIDVLQDKDELNKSKTIGKITIYNSSRDEDYLALSHKLLEL